MALTRSGERLYVPGFAEKLRCSYTTAKREVDALKAEGRIELVGPSKTGHYRLVPSHVNEGLSRAMKGESRGTHACK